MVEIAVPTASVVEPVAPVVKAAVPAVKTTGVVGFLTA
jgi:hypothetical protein